MKKILFLSAFTALTLSFSQQPKLKKQVIEEIIEMKLPNNFISMGDEERLKKFVGTSQSLGVFVSQDRQAYLSINQNKLMWAPKDLNMLKDFYRASINSMFKKTTFFQEEVKEINGRKFVVFEFISTLIDDDNSFSSKKSTSYYNYILYSLYGKGILVFNFNCKKQYQPFWKQTADEMMNSVKVKK